MGKKMVFLIRMTKLSFTEESIVGQEAVMVPNAIFAGPVIQKEKNLWSSTGLNEVFKFWQKKSAVETAQVLKVHFTHQLASRVTPKLCSLKVFSGRH